MPVTGKRQTVHLEGICSVEEAEELLAWLHKHPKGRVHLKACRHVHAAVLQVLLCARPPISTYPDEPFLRRWIVPALEAGTPPEGRAP